MRTVLIMAVVLATATPAAAAGDYDGIWSTVINCEVAPDGAHAYVWRFDASVVNSVVSGGYHQGAAEATGTLTGRIQPNGTAKLTVQGRTGKSEFNLRHAKPGSPIFYTLAAKFDATSASGQRNEDRSCKLTMAKHKA